MIDLKIKKATPTEQLYLARQSTQIAGQTGFIGHLQTDRQGDSKTWTEHNHALYTDNFRQDLEAILQAIKDHKLEANKTLSFRADTAQYSCLFRLDPEKDG